MDTSLTNLLMVVLTAIYVFATVLILLMNKKSSRATEEEVKEIKREWELSDQPHVLVYFEIIRSGIMCFVIENDGKRPAINTRIEIDKDFVSNLPNGDDKEHVIKMLKSKFYIVPKQKFYITIGSIPNFSNIANKKAQIKAIYGVNGNYSENYEIDLNEYGWQLIYKSSLEDIHQDLKKIGDRLKK